MTQLEVTTEQYAQFKESDYVLICSERRGGEVARAWIHEMGTREECEAARPEGCFIVPVGMTIHTKVVATSDITESP